MSQEPRNLRAEAPLNGARETSMPRRKLSPASVRSPGALFLHFAAGNLEAARKFEEGGRKSGEARWQAVELRLASFVFACSAFEAHVVGLHHCFFAHRMRPEEVSAWRARPLPERLRDLLPKRVLSLRRRRLLGDVLELHRRVTQPPPFQVAEQIELFGPPEPPSSGAFWFGPDRGAWVKVQPRREEDDDENRPAGLPKDPLDLTEQQLVTALLVLLEHVLLLDRAFQGWSEWPLSLRHAGATKTAGEWLCELRARYEGPHAAYFRRIRTDLSSDDDGEG